MKRRVKFVSLVMLILFLASISYAQIEFLGEIQIDGEMKDLSNLTNILEEGSSHDKFGGISGIAYTGNNKEYVLLSDRGPADGDANYYTRFHIMDITVDKTGDKWHIQTELKKTVLLKTKAGENFIGKADNKLRLDPEAIQVSENGYIISDEYGPFIYEFDKNGILIREIEVPEKFRVKNISGKKHLEMPPHNTSGRQSNRGFEGVAISPNKKKITAILQSPLIQDSGLDDKNKKVGINIRMLDINLDSNEKKEFVYQLEDSSNGVNEILALNDNEYLVLERDGKKGTKANFKKLFKIDISNATDISLIESLPQNELPKDITPVKKEKFLDLLDNSFSISKDDFPEKIEGVTLGETLPDGRKLLLIAIDNDFLSSQPTVIWAFAVGQIDN
ncbi:MAG: esterase-like activity of phytase family protein [Armatimonadota bacterium]